MLQIGRRKKERRKDKETREWREVRDRKRNMIKPYSNSIWGGLYGYFKCYLLIRPAPPPLPPPPHAFPLCEYLPNDWTFGTSLHILTNINTK